MTTTVDTGLGYRYGLGLYTRETPCGTVWGHDGSIPGYVSFALNDRSGSRSAVVLMPTQPDDPIAVAYESAVATAVCRMFDRGPSLASRSAAASTAAIRPLPARRRASRLSLVG